MRSKSHRVETSELSTRRAWQVSRTHATSQWRNRRAGKIGPYLLQEYKIACGDEEYENGLTFVRALEYEKEGLFLKDIDMTMDYAGSFDKEEVATYLMENRGFRHASSHNEADRTIVDNDHHVGRNCLTYMETTRGVTTRCKIYNKMVQMLEWKGVRESHRTALERLGLLRGYQTVDWPKLGMQRAAEVWPSRKSHFSVITDDEIMEETLLLWQTTYIKSLVHTTSYHLTWKSLLRMFTTQSGGYSSTSRSSSASTFVQRRY